MVAGGGIPGEAPPAPGVRAERRFENGGIEGGAAVGGDLDSFDLPWPDQARPLRVVGPGSRWRLRVMKSGTPGGTISERGSMRVTGSPGSPSAPYIR